MNFQPIFYALTSLAELIQALTRSTSVAKPTATAFEYYCHLWQLLIARNHIGHGAIIANIYDLRGESNATLEQSMR